MSQYFTKPHETSGGNFKVKLHLSNYADLKRAKGIDVTTLASKANLASLKFKVDKLDVDKLETVPASLSNLINVVDVIKKL